MTKTIKAEEITQAVKEMCIEANLHLPGDVLQCMKCASETETWDGAKVILDQLNENYEIAARERIPICQDTGIVCAFVDIGQEVYIDGNLHDAINEGVRQGYTEGRLRKSVVKDPLNRVNTRDNTPAMIYTEIVPGDTFKITIAPKGFGSENMSQLKMLRPSDGVDGVIDFVLKTVREAGPNACPPIVVGVGLGGTFDKSAYLSKKALMRPLDQNNPDPFYADLEKELLERVNELGIGPQGFGGKNTALKVAIESMPTHIAGLPCAVGINCHVTRHIEKEF